MRKTHKSTSIILLFALLMLLTACNNRKYMPELPEQFVMNVSCEQIPNSPRWLYLCLGDGATADTRIIENTIQELAQQESRGEAVDTPEKLSKMAWALAPTIPKIEGYPDNTTWKPYSAFLEGTSVWLISYEPADSYDQYLTNFKKYLAVRPNDGKHVHIFISVKDGHVICVEYMNSLLFPVEISQTPADYRGVLPTTNFRFYPISYSEYREKSNDMYEATVIDGNEILPTTEVHLLSMDAADYAEHSAQILEEITQFSSVRLRCITKFEDGTWMATYHVMNGKDTLVYEMRFS